MKGILGIVSGVLLLAGCAGMDEQAYPTATVTLEPRSGTEVHGTITFTQIGDVVRLTGEIKGHTKGPKGLNIYEKGDCSDPKAMSAGEPAGDPGLHRMRVTGAV